MQLLKTVLVRLFGGAFADRDGAMFFEDVFDLWLLVLLLSVINNIPTGMHAG